MGVAVLWECETKVMKSRAALSSPVAKGSLYKLQANGIYLYNLKNVFFQV